jgi:isoleucyl-tRNA synthetase
MVNYKEDIKLGEEILSRITESYRNIRNRWRFMLGILYDFNPEKDIVSDNDLSEVDLYILSRLQILKKKLFQAYKDFEYHIIYHIISNFFTIDLSSFYLNIMKDNLYCNGKNSKKRKATQYVIFKLLKETLLLMAPILSFTAEEAWEHLPLFKGKQSSVFLHLFPQVEDKYLNLIDDKKWLELLKLREMILKELENARDQKLIGDSLEAEVGLELTDNYFRLAIKNQTLLKELLVVSEITLKQSPEVRITIKKSSGVKCPRCWNWVKSNSNKKDITELCTRCSQVVKETSFDNSK